MRAQQTTNRNCTVMSIYNCMKKHRFSSTTVICVVNVFLWILWTGIGRSKPESMEYRVSPGLQSKPAQTHWLPHPPQNKKDLPIIVTWDAIGGLPDRDIICKTHQCHVTSDRTVIRHHDLLGILFYGTYFALHGLPLPRKPGHLWSLLHRESPANNDWLLRAPGAMELFNLTSTFKRESDYPLSTMWLNDERDLTSTDFVVSLVRKNQLRKEGLAPIVFVHSHCNTPSDRSHYMRILQQYIQIDSYGKCEHNKDFPKENLMFKSDIGPMTSTEFNKLIAQYKFAFAYENSVCDDYVTEKFWRPLNLGVVPLTFGSSKIKDMGPSNHSVIDIRDFPNARKLAEYISFLDKNDTEYSKYLDFKQTGITNPRLKNLLEQRDWDDGRVWNVQYDGFQCFICEKLHELNNPSNRNWSGKEDHFNCPMPKVFDSEGRYVVENNTWEDNYRYGEYYLKSILYHINANKNASSEEIHRIAKELQRKHN